MNKKLKIIIAINVLGVIISTVSVAAMLFRPLSFMPMNFNPNESTAFMGLYVVARNIPLMLGFMWLVKNKIFSVMPFFLMVLALIQVLDSFIGIYYKNSGQVFGPAILAVIHIYTVLYFKRVKN